MTLDPWMDPSEEITVVCPTCRLCVNPGGLVVSGDEWDWTPRPSVTEVRDEMGLPD